MAGATKVAVLGGGAAGLAAAFELTATEELRRKYEVTVYQLGWRLGGKGASGRSPELGERIEEHGLHIWFGFYENAFEVIKRCYEELDRPAKVPIRTWRDAFEPSDEVVLYSLIDGSWSSRRWQFPSNTGEPGTPASNDSFWGVAESALQWLRIQPDRPGGKNELPGVAGFDVVLEGMLKVLRGAERNVPEEDEFGPGNVIGILAGLVGVEAELSVRLLVEAVEQLRDTVWEAEAAFGAAGVRDYAMVFDLITAIISGIAREGLIEKGFEELNDIELRAWLERNGAKRETLEESSALRTFYDLCFAYLEGDRDKPNLAAGKALQALLRLCATYQGSLMWKMQAGMGDAIFAPLYELLHDKRGVQFKFFHAVTKLGLSKDKRNVETIEVVPQVELAGEEYDPLVDVSGLPCWPASPNWRQLANGRRLRQRGVDFERNANPLRRDAQTLKLGEQFDEVVLAIPVGALGPICGELSDHNPAFARMLDELSTVATQALQVWLRAAEGDLGWPHTGATVAGGYEKPLDTYCDMTHLLPVEKWPQAEGVRAIAYFCGVMPEHDESHAEADKRARADGLEHLRRNAAALWPAAVGAENGEFDWSRLVDPKDRRGEARFDAQYWRANTTGSDRYALTAAGSVAHRLRPGESGFDNLALAGDWTRNGICGGSVEAAVTSGRMAAQSISGKPERIPGLDGWLERD